MSNYGKVPSERLHHYAAIISVPTDGHSMSPKPVIATLSYPLMVVSGILQDLESRHSVRFDQSYSFHMPGNIDEIVEGIRDCADLARGLASARDTVEFHRLQNRGERESELVFGNTKQTLDIRINRALAIIDAYTHMLLPVGIVQFCGHLTNPSHKETQRAA